MSLSQLKETLHYRCRVLRFEFRSFHLIIHLKEKFQTTKLFDQKNKFLTYISSIYFKKNHDHKFEKQCNLRGKKIKISTKT
jgi:hypothetical protein